MANQDFSTSEQSSQVAEQMQLGTIENHGLIAQRGLYALTIVMLGFVIWAALAESNVCAEASGKLEPKGRVQIMRPTANGTVAQLLVHDGQEVKKGDTLVVLNTVRAAAELTKKEQEVSILETQLKEHQNALEGLSKAIATPQETGENTIILPDANRVAGELFASKKSFDSATYDITGAGSRKVAPEMSILREQRQRLQQVRKSRMASIQHKQQERLAEVQKLESRVAMLQNSLSKARTQLSELEDGLSDARQEMAIYERGWKLGVASEVKFLAVQNYVHQREFEVSQQRLQLAQLEQDLKSAQIDLSSSQLAYNAEQADLGAGVAAEDTRISSVPISMNETVRALLHKQAMYEVSAYHARAQYAKQLTDVSNTQNKLDELRPAIAMLKAQLSEKHIVSPLDGTVSGLVHLLPGQIVLRGQELMTVVPTNDQLVLRAEVNNIDVGFIELGQDARLRVEAFPPEEFGIIHGKVVRVGDYPEERVEEVGKEMKKVSVYRVTIRPNQTFLEAQGKRYELKPGLKVHADIILRKRSLLALLFDPLLRMRKL